MATVLDLFSRRLLACPTSEHPNAELACDAMKIAAAVRGGRARIDGVIFHTDRGSTYTASSFTLLCKDKLGIRQSTGRVGSCFDNAAAESFFSTLEHEVLSRHHFTTKAESADRRAGLVPRVLQHQTPAQLSGVDVTQRVREDRRRPTGRGIRNPPRFEGKLKLLDQLCRWLHHQQRTGYLRADNDTDPDELVAVAAAHLTRAGHHARDLAAQLDTAHQHVAHLLTG
jgi:transposase InsO family protein